MEIPRKEINLWGITKEIFTYQRYASTGVVLLSLIKDFCLIKATFQPVPKTHFYQLLINNRDIILFLILV